MGVKLRKIKNSDGTTTLMLDIWHNGKRTREFLSQMKLVKPVTAFDREENRQRLELAERIRNKREQQIQADEYDVTPEFRKGIDFLKYFENYLKRYNKKDKRVMEACFQKFKDYVFEEGIKELTSKKVSANVIIQFKEYLEEILNGESPANYFKKFKRVLSNGVKEKIFSPEVSALLASKDKELSIKRNSGIKKEILTFEEIQILANTPLFNKEVKKAFLFSCLTGLRFCDVNVLKWKHIQRGILKINQQKTGTDVTINLNQSAKNIIGKAGKPDTNVFNLPSHNACLKALETWCKKAEISKKITWHCARHSFATGIIYYGGDVKSASSLLGHNSLAYTDRYVKVVEKLKEKSVQNLPEVSIKI
jgi:integrase/recombinase XerD